MKSMERLLLGQLKTQLGAVLDPLQFASWLHVGLDDVCFDWCFWSSALGRGLASALPYSRCHALQCQESAVAVCKFAVLKTTYQILNSQVAWWVYVYGRSASGLCIKGPTQITRLCFSMHTLDCTKPFSYSGFTVLFCFLVFCYFVFAL